MKELSVFFTTVIIFISLLSCVKEKSDDTFSFNKYDKSGMILEEGAILLKVQKMNDSIKNIQIFKKDSVCIRFDEFENQKGVYRKFSNKFRTYYTYNSSEKGGTSSIFPPFVNKETWLINEKTVYVDNQGYEVYHYEEMSYCSPSISTYFVKNLGLIAVLFYDGKKEQYYLCVKIKGDENRTEKLKKINKLVISDSSFFKRAKYLPCDL